MSSQTFAALTEELDRWAEAGRCATLWWRDDDATEPTPAIRRLIDLARKRAVPLGLAVVPATAVPQLAALAGSAAEVTVLQHGFGHIDHAPPGQKSWELGPHRPRDQVLRDLAMGRDRLAELFPHRRAPVLVPPWNRIDPGLAPDLPALGFTCLSTFGPRPEAEAAPGLAQVNSHVDIIRWKAERAFIGAAKTAERLGQHLRERRLGTVDAVEPTGLLTHAWALPEAAWTALDELLRLTIEHPAARWVAVGDFPR